jgi:hypothetical protein
MPPFGTRFDEDSRPPLCRCARLLVEDEHKNDDENDLRSQS